MQWFYPAFAHDLRVTHASVMAQGSHFYLNGYDHTAYRVPVCCVLKLLFRVNDGEDV